MKKLILLLIFISTISLISFSQINDNAIGLSFNASKYFSSVEISYQIAHRESNRYELNFGYGARNEISILQFPFNYH